MGILIPRDLRTNPTSTAVWLASKRRNFIRNGGIAGLGPELQANFDMSDGANGWIGRDSAVTAETDLGESVIKVVSLSVDGFDHVEGSVSGLEIGRSYQIKVRARRGAQGSDQQISDFSWATIPINQILTTSYSDYYISAVATSSSGLNRIYANYTVGAVGDELYISEVSIREFL